MSEQKRNPISTLDDAVLWLAENKAEIVFIDTRVVVIYHHPDRDDGSHAGSTSAWRDIGDGGFDARGTLMMATRELWEKVNA